MIEERIRLEKEISRLPAHDQLKILRYISGQLDVFQQEVNPTCEKKGHEFGRWYYQIHASKKLAGDKHPFGVLQSTNEEWSRRCMCCGYVERVNHQPAASTALKEPDIEKPEEKQKPYMKMKKMYHDI